MTDRFFQVPRTLHRTSAGLVDLPILYFDASNVVSLFEASLEGARHLLEGTGLSPAISPRGRALVGLSFYEYRSTTVGVYNEVGTAVFAQVGRASRARLVFDFGLPPARRRTGAWVADLPVTTEAANAAGRELWGYPKFVTSIDFSLEGRSFRSEVHDPRGEHSICTLSGAMGPSVAVPSLSLVTFSRLDGALVRTHIDVRAPSRLCAPGDVTLQVGASEHRMAANLRALGLEGARPKLLLVTERFQSILPAGARA